MFDIEPIPEDAESRVRLMESVLVAACDGTRGPEANRIYVELRKVMMRDPELGRLLPDFVKIYRDLAHFWPFIKEQSPHWEPRRQIVRGAMTPLFDHVERKSVTPVDDVVSDVLGKLDAESVQAVWQKALARRHNDAEGAITSARTLLETVCKHILDEAGIDYGNKDLPALYRAVAEHMTLAPSQHTEEAFKSILGGATSVVGGLGSLRNKIGDAHGQGKKPVKPSARHAQLAVNMAGTMATFLVETWLARGAGSA